MHETIEPGASALPATMEDSPLFRSLLEAAPDGMVIVDHSGRIVLVNAQTENLFGYRREELVGQRVEMLVPTRSAAEHHRFRSGYVQEPRTRPMGLAGKLFARRKDGSEFPVEISLAPLETDQGLLVSAAVRDITERVRIQAAANRIRDEFFASVSHELRTPLTSMIGYAELMEEVPDLPQQAREFLDVITRSAARELRLVDDLLTLVRLDSEELSMQFEACDLVQLARDALESAAPAATERGLVLDLQVPTGSVTVEGDQGRLGQVLDNLLSNAVKFTAAQGRVTVAVGRTATTGFIEVTDDGHGVDEHDLDRLFDRLFRTQDAVERAIPGAGLGLSIARGIVLAHGGNLVAHNAEGRGITFRLDLPSTD
ncbi:PAS domain S-box protein [Nocardioides terrisoli]|uniref:PAS domain S-box protein n=1 Tax=Nocardioides terrisoli TaxID=3388267 RepID=UPI00287B74D0|nr:PAS domain S-box protein [Nocardioides marmorisolisilvae]